MPSLFGAGAIVAVLAALPGCATSTTSTGGPTGDGGTPTGDGSTAGTPDTAAFCNNLCTRVTTCDHTADQTTCSNSCKNKNAATFPKLRTDIVGLLTDCINNKDCKTVTSTTADVVGTCASEAVASVAP